MGVESATGVRCKQFLCPDLSGPEDNLLKDRNQGVQMPASGFVKPFVLESDRPGTGIQRHAIMRADVDRNYVARRNLTMRTCFRAETAVLQRRMDGVVDGRGVAPPKLVHAALDSRLFTFASG